MIPYGKQDINQSDIEMVINVLKSDNLTQGPRVPEFENTIARYCGANYAIAVNSATSALHIACLALGLKKGDWVWTSPNSFVASANCALYCGAQVDFIDINPKTFNLCADKLEKKLLEAEANSTLPKIIIPVHFAGQSCEMQRIYELSKKYGFNIIEDSSHAIGAEYLGNKIGSCLFSDITVFSFHPVKIVTTAEGGIALTNSPDIASKMSLLRSHGITRDPSRMIKKSEGPWYYEQIDLGFNFRMTELQAALGISQMNRLDDFVNIRHELAYRYDTLLKDLPLTVPWRHPDSRSAYHLYVIRLNLDNTSRTHREVFEVLREKGIGVNLHYIPIYHQPYFEGLQINSNKFPEMESYYKEVMSLPLYPQLSIDDQFYIASTLEKVLS